jgi:hypothetical protein
MTEKAWFGKCVFERRRAQTYRIKTAVGLGQNPQLRPPALRPAPKGRRLESRAKGLFSFVLLDNPRRRVVRTRGKSGAIVGGKWPVLATGGQGFPTGSADDYFPSMRDLGASAESPLLQPGREDAIVWEVKRLESGLIVMGAPGLLKLSRFVRGRVMARLVSLSSRDPGRRRVKPGETFSFRRVEAGFFPRGGRKPQFLLALYQN